MRQTYIVCSSYAQALRGALADLQAQNLHAQDLLPLSKEDHAYRCIRLQDDMGARLMPPILHAQEEDASSISVKDRLDRLEHLGWLPSAEEWSDLRRIRNEFVHSYLDTMAERFAKFQLVMHSASKILHTFEQISQKLQGRFPEIRDA